MRTVRKRTVMKNNIVLIGMPGCGKSTVGVVLAKNLGYKFVDVDIIIQEREGKLLSEIIDERGFDGFIRAEEEACLSVDCETSVIATGGSAVYGKEAMSYFKKIGTVVYIKLGYEEIEERLGDLHQRGVAMHGDMTLRDLYDERTSLYEKYADVVCEADGMVLRDVVMSIKEKIGDFL